MPALIRRFIFKITLLTLIIAGISFFVFSYLLPNHYFDTFPFILLTFPVVSVLAHIQLLKASQKSLARFNVAFMLSFMLKLFVYTALAAAIISLDSVNRMTFVISVMLMYLTFTVFDVKMILDDMKKLNSKNSE